MKLSKILNKIIIDEVKKENASYFLFEFNKSQSLAIANKLGIERDEKLEKILNKLKSQGYNYQQLKNKLGKEIRNLNDLEGLTTTSKSDIKKQEKSKIEKEADVILDNDKFFIVRPESTDASCFYGKGTKWCTAATDSENYFKKYRFKYNVTLYYIFDKQKKNDPKWSKVAIAVYDRDIDGKNMEAFDAQDNSIDPKKYLQSKNLDINLFKSVKKNPWDLAACVDGTYEIDENGFVNVNGNVNLIRLNLKEIPHKFGKISGNFKCEFNQLISLKNAPYEISGNFDCSYNKLTSLEFCPKKVTRSFICNNNQLTSLKGCPKEIGGHFYCHENQLKSLQFGPKKVNMNYYCNTNQLTSLKGCPKEIGGYFSCEKNKLISLKGAPSVVGDGFNCSFNKLESLEGCPKKIGTSFDCSYNKLTSLEGVPKEIGTSFDCSYNKLTSLEGLPKKIKTNLSVGANSIKLSEKEIRMKYEVGGKIYT